MSNPVFIGRKAEIEQLKTLYKKKTSSLVVVKGRRRIGKSRLIREFAQISGSVMHPKNRPVAGGLFKCYKQLT
jgi:AAA+ ATPase superfamily predicted ATPase